MGSSGIASNKFVSVNLNKSYGQQQQCSGPGSGQPAGGRSRQGGHGGMLVLSRPRSAQGAGTKGSKLAVPPPLNLPSLRREHGGGDPVGHTTVSGTSASGPLGWTKPAPPASANTADGEQAPEKIAALSSGSTWGTNVPPSHPVNTPGSGAGGPVDSGGRPSVYTPPAARAKNGSAAAPAPALGSVAERTSVVLRGEDFPLLQASLPQATPPLQKLKDAQQKQRKNQEDLKEQKFKLHQLSQQKHQHQQQEGLQDGASLHSREAENRSPPPMRPQVKPRQQQTVSRENFQINDRAGGVGGNHLRKPEGYTAGPPPLVRLDHTSNWADDERDTGRNMPDLERNEPLNNDDSGYVPYQRNGSFPGLGSGRDASAFPHYEKGNLRADNGREMWLAGDERDASFRRGSPFRKEVNFTGDVGFDRERVGFGRAPTFSRENTSSRDHDVENKSIRGYGRPIGQSWESGNGRGNLLGRETFGKDSGSWDQGFRESYSRDGGYSQGGQIGNRGRDGFLRRGVEQNNAGGRYGDTFGRNRGLTNDAPQSNAWNKPAFSTGSRGMHVNDPILDFGRDKRSFSSYGKPYSEDPFTKDFGAIPGLDLRDPFVGGLATEIKVPRRRKDDSKQTDFYDPIRESFEAELERVQKMQEQERQRMIEEQERAQELARKEEEERQRLAREEEERQRRLEEEAREAVWRAEQQALEAARRSEEERRAREEERRRIIMEEERRKEAARRKLLELEERIAKRKAESKKEEDLPNTDEGRLSVGRSVHDRDGLRRADTGEWEDEERKIDRITSSASSESSSVSRSFDSGMRSRDANSFASDRTKPPSPWRRELTENGNSSHLISQMMAVDQNNGYQSSYQETLHGARGFPRRDLLEGTRTGSAGKILPKMGRSETMQVNDHMPYRNDHRWSSGDDGTQFSRMSNTDTEFFENTVDGYADIAWEQEKIDSWRGKDRPRIPSALPYTRNSDVDELAFGRSRHFRQPRVLPPPSVTALQKGLLKNGAEKPVSSPLLDEEPKRPKRRPSDHDIPSKMEFSLEQDHVEKNLASAVDVSQDVHLSEEQGLKNMIQLESQSLPSVSSLPSSPVHVLHDDLEEVESPMFQQNEAEMSASCNLDGLLHNVISAEGLKPDEFTESGAPPSKSPEQEKHEELVFEYDDFSEEEEYEEERLYEEEDEVFEEEEESPEKDYDYGNLHAEEQTIELNNENDLHIDRVEIKDPISEEIVLPNGNESELQGKHDSGMHQEAPLEVQHLVEAKDIEHEMLESEASETQMEGLVDDGGACDKAQPHLMQGPIVRQAPLEETSRMVSVESLQVAHPDMQNSRQSLAQPPQQSLSSISSPLRQSDVSSTTLAPSILTQMSALPTQSERPFKLQFGLFPGTSILAPTVPAIQIGSIPLHLQTQVSPSLTQIPPSQPPMFQFGQLRYPAPISQSLLTLTQPPMPYVHPTVSGHYSLGHPVMPLSTQQILDSSLQKISANGLQQNNFLGNQADPTRQRLTSPLVNKRLATEANSSQESKGNMDSNPLSSNQNVKSVPAMKSSVGQSMSAASLAVGKEQIKSSQLESEVEKKGGNKVYKPVTNALVISEQGQNEVSLVQSSSGALQTVGRGKGNRAIYGARTDGLRTLINTSEGTWSATDARRHRKPGRRNIRRSEFRVSVDRRQLQISESNNLTRQEKSRSSADTDFVSNSTNRGVKKDLGLSGERSMKSEGASKAGYGISFAPAHHEDKVEKIASSKLPHRSGVQVPVANGSRSGEGILKKSEVADDVPLQSGVVRIFKQSGIEAPSDEDDFIEVRSKRQMLNDRREQREKEIKAKSKDLKAKDQATRRQRPSTKSSIQGDGMPAISNKGTASSGGEKRNSTSASAVILENTPFDGRNLSNVGSSASLVATAASPQPLAPIGTPGGNTEGSNDKRSIPSKPIQTNPVPVISHCDADVGKGLRLENQNLTQECIASTSMGAWGTTRTSQQVVSLAQIQLEEAMKPGSFEAKRAPLFLPLSDGAGMALEPGLSVTSVLGQDKAVPLNSLLGGEKIQFGAMTSPTILPPLPPSSTSIIPSVSTGLGPSVACRSDGTMETGFSAPEGDSTNFFSKTDDRCRPVVDPEAEAEAAASAVAVAAISSDESVGNGLGVVSMSAAENKAFGNSDGASSVGVSTTRPALIQSRGEDSMTVALPADLSVETPSPLSLWTSVASRQSSAGPVLPHFPGAPSHFPPCFDMGPIMGSPIFAFGQHEEVTSLSQAQKSNTSVEQGISGMGAGPVGGWQQCHNGVDSFYGAPPSGFTGPFITPPGGIPGIPGPPPMFVYNPFASVGQFGQVGFMSAQFIQSGKRPDWTHTPSSTSGVSLNEGDIGNLGMMSAQRNASMPSPVQHMPTASSMMPVVPSLGLFDMNLSSPFQQSSADLPMQAQWSHVSGHPTFQTMPMSGPMVGLSMPLQQVDGLSTQLSHPSHVIETGGKRFHQVVTSKTTGSGPFSSVDAAAQFPDELGLGDSVSTNNSSVLTSHNLSVSSANVKVQKVKSSSRSARSSGTGSGSESSALAPGTNSISSSNQSLHGSRTVGPHFQPQGNTLQTAPGQYLHPVGHSEQRGTSQQHTGHTGHKTSVANEWSAQSHRKVGAQGRSQISGDKSFTTAKIKQVYVPKPPVSTSNVSTPVTLL